MFAKIESERLRYIQCNQKKLRVEEYINLRDVVVGEGVPAPFDPRTGVCGSLEFTVKFFDVNVSGKNVHSSKVSKHAFLALKVDETVRFRDVAVNRFPEPVLLFSDFRRVEA
ncbi:hypothetical protein TNCV_2637791 [Trichonephila clavipes]|nr:hypothetical protein TNCV_2637791 [Trichonephila clavipes]